MKKIYLFFIITAVTVLLTGFALTKPLWYDDSCHYLIARNLAFKGHETLDGADNPSDLFRTIGIAVNFSAALIIHFFGDNLIYLRFWIILHSLALLVAIVFLSKFLFGKTLFFWSTLGLGLNLQFLTYGSQFLGEIPAMAFTFWGLFFFLRAFNYPTAQTRLFFLLTSFGRSRLMPKNILLCL